MKQRGGKRRKKGQGWLTPRVISKQRRGWIAAAAELIKFRSFAYYFSSPRRRRDANVCRNTGPTPPPPPWPRATSAIRVQTCSFFPYFPFPPPPPVSGQSIAYRATNQFSSLKHIRFPAFVILDEGRRSSRGEDLRIRRGNLRQRMRDESGLLRFSSADHRQLRGRLR